MQQVWLSATGAQKKYVQQVYEPSQCNRCTKSLTNQMRHSHIANNQVHQCQVLLMTCQAQVNTPEGTTMQARALLDLASSTSFITKHLAWQLQLPRKNRRIQVAGISGVVHDPLSHTVAFGVSGLLCKGERRSPH